MLGQTSFITGICQYFPTIFKMGQNCWLVRKLVGVWPWRQCGVELRRVLRREWRWRQGEWGVVLDCEEPLRCALRSCRESITDLKEVNVNYIKATRQHGCLVSVGFYASFHNHLRQLTALWKMQSSDINWKEVDGGRQDKQKQRWKTDTGIRLVQSWWP